MVKPIRRIVTGHDADGRSIILMDGPAPTVLKPTPNLALTDLWETKATPASNAGDADATARPVHLTPPRHGSIFRVVEFPPDGERDYGNREAAFAAMGAAHALDREKPRHPGFHKTDTVDYAIVLDGEIWAMMDVGETLMKAGDTLVQRGTNHSWSNRSDKPCRVAFILIDAEPV
jgi:hypothetical protein